jgi:hypothetical protein
MRKTHAQKKKCSCDLRLQVARILCEIPSSFLKRVEFYAKASSNCVTWVEKKAGGRILSRLLAFVPIERNDDHRPLAAA